MTNIVEILEQVGSTNEYLQNLFTDDINENFKAVATFNQTKGRGQKGNLWHSEPGCNICYSMAIIPDIPAQNQFLISQAISLAVKSFLDKHIQHVSVKWPNDIFWKDKKIAGILIENKLTGVIINHSIVGIGININEIKFPAMLEQAVSLKQITGLDYDLVKLTNDLHQTLVKAIADLSTEKAGDIQRFYLNSLFRRDGIHGYKDKEGSFEARIRGIGAKGDLILELEDGSLRSYSFKEVSFNL